MRLPLPRILTPLFGLLVVAVGAVTSVALSGCSLGKSLAPLEAAVNVGDAFDAVLERAVAGKVGSISLYEGALLVQTNDPVLLDGPPGQARQAGPLTARIVNGRMCVVRPTSPFSREVLNIDFVGGRVSGKRRHYVD